MTKLGVFVFSLLFPLSVKAPMPARELVVPSPVAVDCMGRMVLAKLRGSCNVL